MQYDEPEIVATPYSLDAKETLLVDRIEEMERLKQGVNRAINGQGESFFLYGEAGIGKTKLTKELGAYGRSRGMQTLYGRCPALSKMGSISPYALWKEIIREYLQKSTPEQLQRAVGFYPGEIFKLVPEIKQKLVTFSESPPLNPSMERERLYEALSQFIFNISRETPLILVLDDLQWADPSSLSMMHYIVRGIYREKLFLLGAYRDSEIEEKHPLSPIISELNRIRLLQFIQLNRMSKDDTAKFVLELLGQKDVPPEFCDLVYEKTLGNPFFVEEVITSLKEEKAIVREEGTYVIKTTDDVLFPKTVKDVLKARINRVDEESQKVLGLAAFIGNDFTLKTLLEVTGLEESKLLELIEKTEEKGLLKCKLHHGEDKISFSDILIRDVLYEEVSPLKKKRIHSIVGIAVEKVYASNIDEHYGELASHFLESGDKQKALDYFVKAGKQAQLVYANSEAAFYFEEATNLLEKEKSKPREKADVLEMLGDVKGILGDYVTSLKHLNESLSLWNQLMDKKSTARLHRKIANILWSKMGNKGEANEHYDIALKILELVPESIELASLRADRADALFHAGDIEIALFLSHKALETAKKLSAYEVIASSYLVFGEIFWMKGDQKKSLESFKKALNAALKIRYAEAAIEAYNWLGYMLSSSEKMEKSMEYYQKGYELAKKTGAISAQSKIGNFLAQEYVDMGELKTALPLAEEAVAIDRKIGHLHNLSLSLWGLGHLYKILGEWDKSEQCLYEMLSISKQANFAIQIPLAYFGLAGLFMEREEHEKVANLLVKGFEVFRGKIGVMQYSRGNIANIVLNLIDLKEFEQAEKFIEKLQEGAQELHDERYLAFVDLSRAIFYRAQKRWEESIQYFQKSLRGLDELNAKRWNVYNFAKLFLCQYARVYLERDQEGDRERAYNLLNQALEIFQKIGAKKDIEKVEANLRYIESGDVADLQLKSVNHISTGFTHLDELLCGGIPLNFAVVLTSPSCDEKDSLIKSFLETGVINGEATFYVTIDPNFVRGLVIRFPSNFYLFDCNPHVDGVIRSAPNVFKLNGIENLTEMYIALTKAIRNLDSSVKDSRRICLNIISDVLLHHRSVQTRKWLIELITKLKSQLFTVLAVVDSQMHSPEELYAVLNLFDGEINIKEKETEKGLQKILRVKRMSNQKYIKDELLLT